MFRGSVRAPPLFFEDKGYFVIDAITRQIIDDKVLLAEINNKPITDYVLNTENKYSLEVYQPKSEFREVTEVAYDFITRKNIRNYKQYYENRGGYGGRTGYDRLYVPRRYEISFLKNYLVSLPVWSFESEGRDGLRHSSLMFASSGSYWQDSVFCPECNTKISVTKILNCEVCGKRICNNCAHQTGLIFKKKLCPNCHINKGS